MTERAPSAAERALWRSIVRSVKRLDRTTLAPDFEDEASLETVPPPAPVRHVRQTVSGPARLSSPILPQSFDHETERRLQKNQVRVEGRLDLHGMTAVEAHAALVAFIENAISRRCRIVLVITGKGNLGSGLLKRSLPHWLESFPHSLRYKVVAIRPALPHHGGEGAYYVQLKRTEPKHRA